MFIKCDRGMWSFVVCVEFCPACRVESKSRDPMLRSGQRRGKKTDERLRNLIPLRRQNFYVKADHRKYLALLMSIRNLVDVKNNEFRRPNRRSFFASKFGASLKKIEATISASVEPPNR